MSLRPQTDLAVPDLTARVARAAFPKGNAYLTARDGLGTLFHDDDFADLYSDTGQPASAPWRLALVTVFQFAENLTDRQAADAVRARLDWKYALSLDLEDAGFDFSVLSEFRGRLLDGGAEERLLGRMLDLFKERGLVKARGRQRTDSTHVLAAVRELNRLELVGETMLHALNALAEAAPEWLRRMAPPEWPDRYRARFTGFHLPRAKAKREVLSDAVGADGWHLLGLVYDDAAPEHLRRVSAVETLRRVWLQQYQYARDDSGGGRLRWRKSGNLPPAALMVSSPYDTEARHSSKRGGHWRGYKVHLTEACDDDGLLAILNVETTVATDQDWASVEPVHCHLGEKGLLPAEHFVDSAYTSADLLADSRTRHGVDLVGPIRPNRSWQMDDDDSYDVSHFALDWDREVATCPQGHESRYWKPAKRVKDRGTIPMVQVHFHPRDCAACPARPLCTRKRAGPRELTLHVRDHHEAMVAARERQETGAFWGRYSVRAGVEGAVSQGVRTSGMRRSRYRGMAKTHLQHVATAAAMNLKRAVDWLDGVPRSRSYQSPFSALMAA